MLIYTLKPDPVRISVRRHNVIMYKTTSKRLSHNIITVGVYPVVIAVKNMIVQIPIIYGLYSYIGEYTLSVAHTR
jgi:hypothetical protein